MSAAPSIATLSPEAARREAWLAALREPFVLEGAGKRLEIQPETLKGVDTGGLPVMRVSGTAGGEPFEVVLGRDAIVALLREVPGSARADPPTRALILEHILTPALDAAERMGCPAITLERLDDGPSAAPTAPPIGGLRVTWDKITGGLALYGGSALAERYDRFVGARPARRQKSAKLTVGVTLTVGATELSIAECRALKPGDAILFDATAFHQGKLVAVFGNDLAQFCSLKDAATAILDGEPQAHHPRIGPLWLSDYATGGIMSEQAGAPRGRVADIRIKLTFEAGRLELPVAEVERIGAGHVFNLGRPAAEGVDIIAGGRVIGSGDIIKIGEDLGVRVRRIEP